LEKHFKKTPLSPPFVKGGMMSIKNGITLTKKIVLASNFNFMGVQKELKEFHLKAIEPLS
jgi:hypothetical protein